MARVMLLLAVFWLVAPEGAWAQVAARIEATRTSGVAPLVVVFDAKGTTHSNGAVKPFHDITYTFNFGEKRNNPRYAAVWGTSAWGAPGDEFLQRFSKDQYFGGPIAGHVFDNPGTYTVTVTATDSNGASNTASVQVVVQDPNSVYAGSKTACVRANASSSFDGCPSGAQQVTQANLGSAINGAGGRRVLLRRGDTFSGSGVLGAGGGILGAFGSGPKPVINGPTNPTGRGSVVGVQGGDWRVMDLAVRLPQAPAKSDITGFNLEAVTSDTLFYRLEVDGGVLGFNTADARGNTRNHMVDCRSAPATNGGYSVTLELRSAFVAGNLINAAGIHLMRTWGASDSAYQFNKFTGRPTGQIGATFITHQYQFPLKPESRRVVIGYQKWESGTTFPGGIGSNTPDKFGELTDYMIENNFFNGVPDGFGVQSAQRVTVRNNVGKSNRIDHGVVTVREQEPLPARDENGFASPFQTRDVWVHNNTCVGTNSSQARCVEVIGNVPNVNVRNNLLYGPNTTNVSPLAGTVASSGNNVGVGSNGARPIASSDPSLFDDYKVLNAGGGAGAGVGPWAVAFGSPAPIPPQVPAPGAPTLLSATPVP